MQMREGGENHIGPQEFFPALPHPPTPFLFPSTVQLETQPYLARPQVTSPLREAGGFPPSLPDG
jgi:hypothetical protein